MRLATLLLMFAGWSSAQVVETLAGFDPDGAPAQSIGLTMPVGVAVDAGGSVYFSLPMQQRIYKVTPEGVIRVVARGLENPGAVAVDPAGNIYAATAAGIQAISFETGLVRIVAPVEARGDLRSVAWLALSPNGQLVAADNTQRMLKYVDPESGAITHLAGSGKGFIAGDNSPAALASLQAPGLVAVDGQGNVFYAELFEPTVRRIDVDSKVITNVRIGVPDEDIPGESEVPTGLSADAAGNLYVAQGNRGRILKVAPDGAVSVFAKVGFPAGMAADGAGALLAAELQPPRIWRISGEGEPVAVAGNGLKAYNGDGAEAVRTQLAEPANVLPAANGDVYIASTQADRVLRIGPEGTIRTVAGGGAGEGSEGTPGEPPQNLQLTRPQALWLDANGDLLFSDYDNRALWRVLGDGSKASLEREIPVGTTTIGARLQQAGTLAGDGTRLYLTSPNDHHVWVMEAGRVKVLAGTGEAGFDGDGGAAKEAKLRNPSGLALDKDGNLLVADTRNHRIRKVETATGLISTVWPSGDVDEASLPAGLAFGPDGLLYASDAGLSRVWKIDLAAGKLETAFEGGLDRPAGIAFDKDGRLYVADTGNQRVLRVTAKRD